MSADNSYHEPLESALKHALTYLDQLENTSVSAQASLDELRTRLSRPLVEEGTNAQQIIDELVSDTSGGLLGTMSGRFFGWVVGGSLPAALAADWLTSTWDQNAALYACSPAEAVIEEICGAWLKDLLGLPSEASFGLVTGCQMAHVTCLSAARNAILSDLGWDVERQGLNGSPPIKVLTSDQHHASVNRAIRILGLGTDCLISLPTNENGQLSPLALEEALKKYSPDPLIVVLHAGDLNIGAYDSFKELIPMAHSHNAWVHVDGAFGLWAAASAKYRHFLEGVEMANSWATDGHKWLNVPYDCGYAFVRNSKAHYNAMALKASYLVHDNNARDQFNWNPEWSRRGRGVATYAAIRELGRRGVSSLVERCCQYAHDLVTQIGALPGVSILWEPQINQGLLRFHDPKSMASEADHDDYTDEVISDILQSGEAFFGGTTWRNKRCMRVSVCSWRTTDDDIARVVSAVGEIISSKRKAFSEK